MRNGFFNSNESFAKHIYLIVRRSNDSIVFRISIILFSMVFFKSRTEHILLAPPCLRMTLGVIDCHSVPKQNHVQ